MYTGTRQVNIRSGRNFFKEGGEGEGGDCKSIFDRCAHNCQCPCAPGAMGAMGAMGEVQEQEDWGEARADWEAMGGEVVMARVEVQGAVGCNETEKARAPCDGMQGPGMCSVIVWIVNEQHTLSQYLGGGGLGGDGDGGEGGGDSGYVKGALGGPSPAAFDANATKSYWTLGSKVPEAKLNPTCVT